MKPGMKILKKIAMPVLGLVIAGVTVLEPISVFASAGDSSSVTGEIEDIPCSGSTTINYRSASSTTVFYGNGTITAKVTLVCKDKSGKYHTVTASKTDSGIAGVTATVVREDTSWETEYADGEHIVKYHGYTWHKTTRASR